MHQPKDTDWLNGYKSKTHIYTASRTPTLDLVTHTDWKENDGKKYFMWIEKKVGVAIPNSDKIDFKIKIIIRDKEGHYIMIKVSIQGEDISILNIYVPNIVAPQSIRQTLTGIRGEMDSNQ